jgi:chromosome segregation ATPase
MSGKKQDFSVLYDLYKTLANISAAVGSFKGILCDLVDMVAKQGTDQSLLNQKIDFLKEQLKEMEEQIKEISTKITQITIQTDYREKVDFKHKQQEITQKKQELKEQENELRKKEKDKWIERVWDTIIEFFKNSKWLAIILATLLIIFASIGGSNIITQLPKILSAFSE